MKLVMALLINLILLNGCVSSWDLVTTDNSTQHIGQLIIHAPTGWVIYKDHENIYPAVVKGIGIRYRVERLMLTKNGVNLDLIDIKRFSLTNAFPSIEQSADNSMMPDELAEKYLAEKQIILGLDNLSVVRNEPVKIANQTGFLLQFTNKDAGGLQYSELIYGFAAGTGFYTIAYHATSLHFFEHGISDFDAMIKTLILNA